MNRRNGPRVGRLGSLAALAVLAPLLLTAEPGGEARLDGGDVNAEAGAERPSPSFSVGRPRCFSLRNETECVTWPLPSSSIEGLTVRLRTSTRGGSEVAMETLYQFNPEDWEDGRPVEGELLVLVRSPEGGPPTVEFAVDYPGGSSGDTPTSVQSAAAPTLGRGLEPRNLRLTSARPLAGSECAVLALVLSRGSGLSISLDQREAGYDMKELAALSAKHPGRTVVVVTVEWEPRN